MSVDFILLNDVVIWLKDEAFLNRFDVSSNRKFSRNEFLFRDNYDDDDEFQQFLVVFIQSVFRSIRHFDSKIVHRFY
jgi:hydroxypyruvate isomerase